MEKKISILILSAYMNNSEKVELIASIIHIERFSKSRIPISGIYQNNFDVRYTAQETQSSNSVLAPNLHTSTSTYVFVCSFIYFCFVTELLEFICSSVFSDQN